MSTRQHGKKMVLHASRMVTRGFATRYTTLCGRTNAKSRDGMNIADTVAGVTCKFCLRALANAGGAK